MKRVFIKLIPSPLLLMILFSSIPLFGLNSPVSLKVCAFQTVLDPSEYADFTTYTESLAQLVYDHPGQDLYVFPEYTSAVAFTSFLTPPGRIDPVFLAENLKNWNRRIQAFWEELASETGSYILAGTTLAVEKGRLYNRAWVFSPPGLFHTQDKAFLGDPEILLGLTPGSQELIKPFRINGIEIALTVCRDTYNPVWNSQFENIDLWIDIKGNELAYTREYFDQALPARLREYPGNPLGLTLCVTGPWLDFTFSGISSLIRGDQTLLETESPYKAGVLVFTVFPGGGTEE